MYSSSMNKTNEAQTIATAYYHTLAMAGRLDGYSNDDLFAFGMQTLADAQAGIITAADCDPDFL